MSVPAKASATARLERAVAGLRKAEMDLQKAEALPRARKLTAEERDQRTALFGTRDDRAVVGRLWEVLEAIEKQPDPVEAARRIPPTLCHAVDSERVLLASKWLADFNAALAAA